MAAIIEILEDLKSILKEDPDALVAYYTDEIHPLHLEIDLAPLNLAAVPQGNPKLSHASPDSDPDAPAQESANSQITSRQKTLTKNYLCNLCQDRMYPVKNYYVKGQKPVLVLHHTGSFLDGKFRRDTSHKYILGGQYEDDIFARMLGACGFGMDDFHFQEYLACHFNPERSVEEDWNERGAHCLAFVKETLLKESIRHMILTGPAAVLLLGLQKSRELSASANSIDLPLGKDDAMVHTMVIRSPMALLEIESRRKQAKSANQLEDLKKYTEMEKEIKSGILASLKKFLEPIR